MSELVIDRIPNSRRDSGRWVPGPWDNEPDKIVWKHAGLDVMIRRGPLGIWCGYVGLPQGHSLHGTDYDNVKIDCPEELTYSAECRGDPIEDICHPSDDGKHVWWLGFDCGHYYDVIPSMIENPADSEYRLEPEGDTVRLYTLFRGEWMDQGTYKTVSQVRKRTEILAEELARSS